MASKNDYKDDWQGMGWYVIRKWRHTDGRYTVEDWESPEQADAYWYETEDEFAEDLTDDPECTSIVWYYGGDECPDDTVCVAPGYDFDYDIWDHLRENFSHLYYSAHRRESTFVPALYRLLADYRDELTAKLR